MRTELSLDPLQAASGSGNTAKAAPVILNFSQYLETNTSGNFDRSGGEAVESFESAHSAGVAQRDYGGRPVLVEIAFQRAPKDRRGDGLGAYQRALHAHGVRWGVPQRALRLLGILQQDDVEERLAQNGAAARMSPKRTRAGAPCPRRSRRDWAFATQARSRPNRRFPLPDGVGIQTHPRPGSNLPLGQDSGLVGKTYSCKLLGP